MTDKIGVLVLANEFMDHTADSILITAGCGHACWVAEAGRREMEKHGDALDTRCMACALPDILRKGQPVVAAEGSLEAVGREFGVGAQASAEGMMHSLNMNARRKRARDN